jgi:hypothetical protein
VAKPLQTANVASKPYNATADQSCARQERDLTAFADRAGYEVVSVFKETGSGVRLDREGRRKVMALAGHVGSMQCW